MNKKLAVISMGLALLPASAAAALTTPASAVATGQRQLADGTVLQPAAPHRWRASADPAHQRAWTDFTAQMGPAWATWADGHPRQIIGAGLPAPGVIASATEAERVAWEVLTRHVELLAPGSTPSDFVLVSNLESGGVRSVGFQQRSAGRDVVGGQIGLSFVADRLVMITSLAQPVALAMPASVRVSDAEALTRARGWIERDVTPAALHTPAPVVGPVVLPTGDATTGPRHREVLQVEVRTEAPLGRWRVYVDARTGEPVARESLMHSGMGRVFYNVAERSPMFGRSDRPATFTEHVVNGAPQVSDVVGWVSFNGPTATVEPGLTGPFVEIFDESGPLATGVLNLADGGGTTWNLANNEFHDAQLTTFAHTSFVKSYVRSIDPTLAWLDGTIVTTVNIDDQCNAMSDGDSLFFFRSSQNCENTGRMSDVVYHEFGHSVHHQSLIPGVGAFDGALSEGISDYLAATLVNDSAMARGFFFTEDPLRELDPEGFEWTWPEDNGEIHDAGRIIGGTLWDLRTLLIAKYGMQEGVRRADVLWYEATRRAVDMPSMYGAALTVNDDDGDLSNGTPDGCEINAAFGAHGLFGSNTQTAEQVTAEEVPEGLRVRVDLALPSFEACPIEATASVEWGARDDGGAPQSAEMTPVEGGFEAIIPRLPDGQVMTYRSVIRYSLGTERIVPSNLAYPWFEHWFGPVEPIYCTSFEDGTAAGWDLPPIWDVGEPEGRGGDPAEVAGADPFVLGLDLHGDGLYEPWSTETAVSPVIDIPAGYDSVRLHYQRWLTVEDGFWDQSVVYADGEPAWTNFASDQEFVATVHHRDAQWSFHDVDLSPWAADGQVQLAFEIVSDGGLEMGGWTLDELCVVGVRSGGVPPTAGCGNGVVEAGEECDDGNVAAGDGCDATCRREAPGQGDSGGDDPGGDPLDPDEDMGSLQDDRLLDRGCACRAGPGGEWPDGTGLLALLWLGWRRRRA